MFSVSGMLVLRIELGIASRVWRVPNVLFGSWCCGDFRFSNFRFQGFSEFGQDWPWPSAIGAVLPRTEAHGFPGSGRSFEAVRILGFGQG